MQYLTLRSIYPNNYYSVTSSVNPGRRRRGKWLLLMKLRPLLAGKFTSPISEPGYRISIGIALHLLCIQYPYQAGSVLTTALLCMANPFHVALCIQDRQRGNKSPQSLVQSTAALQKGTLN